MMKTSAEENSLQLDFITFSRDKRILSASTSVFILHNISFSGHLAYNSFLKSYSISLGFRHHSDSAAISMPRPLTKATKSHRDSEQPSLGQLTAPLNSGNSLSRHRL